MPVCLGPQLSKLAVRISEPFVKCLQQLNDHTCISYWLNQTNIVLSWFKLTQTVANYNFEVSSHEVSICLDSSEFFQHQ